MFFRTYLLSACCIPGTLLGPGDSAVYEADKPLSSGCLHDSQSQEEPPELLRGEQGRVPSAPSEMETLCGRGCRRLEAAGCLWGHRGTPWVGFLL